MQKKIVAAAMVVLFALIGFMAVMSTDFHDRSWPQSLKARTTVALDFTAASLSNDDATELVVDVGQNHQLGLVKLAPDLDHNGLKVFVELDDLPQTEVTWFGDLEPSEIVGVERLENSPADGTYVVQDSTNLYEAITELSAYEIGVSRADASLPETIVSLAIGSWFVAPMVAAILLVTALVVFWLATRARSRALRVLGGAPPWHIQVQDVSGFLALLFGSAIVVAAVSTTLAGILRGWQYVQLFAQSLLLLMGGCPSSLRYHRHSDILSGLAQHRSTCHAQTRHSST